MNYIKSKGCKAGVAINPHSDINFLENVLDQIDLILIMTVNPGFGGQKFIQSMLKKIALTKTLIDDRDILLEVDGGISPLNSKDVINAGANVLVAGSSIFSSHRNANYSKNIAALRN